MKGKKIIVAQFGRAVGLKGEIKLHLQTDFPEQFVKGRKITTDRGIQEIEYYNPKRGLIKLLGINTPEDAKKITNAKIYASEEESKEYCKLEEGQYFWFEIIDCKVIENNEVLGVVKDISRLPSSDYLEVVTDEALIKQGFAKSFLIPYLPNFIKSVSVEEKKIEVSGAKDILEAS